VSKELVLISVKIYRSQKDRMKKLHLNVSDFTRAALAEKLETFGGCDD
jgi:hypothetical protein